MAPAAGARLSEQGLYSDIGAKIVSRQLVEFEPRFKLWSDAAEKQRWVMLPRGADGERLPIVTHAGGDPNASMDRWLFPIGTRFFKEFSIAGKRVETRLIIRLSADDYFMGSFVWDEAETDAVFEPKGVKNVLGTSHDVPAVRECRNCHEGEAGRILGFSAIQLSKDPIAGRDDDVTLASLVEAGLLTESPPSGGDVRLRDDPIQVEALGTLHANCGHCHNPDGAASFVTRRNGLVQTLRLAATDFELQPGQREIVASTVGIATGFFTDVPFRIAAGKPDDSAVMVRMASREPGIKMPPIATKEVDVAGIAAVRTWIEGIPLQPVVEP